MNMLKDASSLRFVGRRPSDRPERVTRRRESDRGQAPQMNRYSLSAQEWQRDRGIPALSRIWRNDTPDVIRRSHNAHQRSRYSQKPKQGFITRLLRFILGG